MRDQIRGKKLMGPLCFSKYLLSPNSVVLSAFKYMASLNLHSNHIAVPRLPIRKLSLREIQGTLVKTRKPLKYWDSHSSLSASITLLLYL